MTDKDLTPEEKKLFLVVNEGNKLIIRDTDAWLGLWQQVIAYYWSVELNCNFDPLLHKALKLARGIDEQNRDFNNKNNILFYILNQLGLKNMLLVYEVHGDKDSDKCVALLPFETQKTPYIVKLKIAQNLPTPTFNTAAAYVGAKNGWENITLNLTIKIPPLGDEPNQPSHLTALSDYVAFKGYFPFAHTYTDPYDSKASASSLFNAYNLSMAAMVAPPCDRPVVCSSQTELIKGVTEALNQWSVGAKDTLDGSMSFVHDMQRVIFDTIQTRLAAEQKVERPQVALVGGVGVDTMTPGDRGGAPGMTGDYAWMNFVPRLVSCNWSRFDFGTLKHDSLLSNYTDLMNNLGYTIPDGLNIKIRYAENVPWNPIEELEVARHILNENEQQLKLDSLIPYVSILEVLLPEAPQKDGSIALANLIAKRADAPFTTG